MLSWVKQHATDVSSVIGRDLAEFAEVVAGDTRAVLDPADAAADDGSSAAAAALRATGDADAAAAAAGGVGGAGGGSGPVPDEAAVEEAVQSDMKTYVEPLSDAVGVARWREATEWSLEGAQEEVAAVLAAAPRVATYHAELVPASVSEADFWLRYCYRLHAAQQAARRRRVLRAIEAQERDTLMRRSASAREDDWGMATDPKALMKLLTESRAECAALKKKVTSLESEVAELRKEKAGGGGVVAASAAAVSGEGSDGAAAAQEAAAQDEAVAAAAEPATVDGGEEGGGQGVQAAPQGEASEGEGEAEAEGKGSGVACAGVPEAAATPKAKGDDWNALADWS